MRGSLFSDVTQIIIALALIVFVLTACSPRVVYRDRIVTVSVPVAQPCAGTRPDIGPALRDSYSAEQWAALDLVQRTAAVGVRAIERMDHTARLEAATAACP